MEKASIAGVVHVWGPMADAGALGLGSFALTTFMLSIHITGWAPNYVWLTLALFYGGATQFIAAMFEYAKNQVFGATVFATYGSFWLALALFNLLFVMPGAQFLLTDSDAIFSNMGWFITGWFMFNTIYLICSLQTSVTVFLVLFFLELTELCLMIGFFNGQAAGAYGTWTMAGGYFGFFCSIVAFYASFALTFNCIAGRQVVPMGGPLVSLSPGGRSGVPVSGASEAGAPLTGDGF